MDNRWSMVDIDNKIARAIFCAHLHGHEMQADDQVYSELPFA